MMTLAQEQENLEPVKVTAQVDKAVVTSLDEVTYTISLVATKEYSHLEIPEFGDTIVGFRVIDFGQEGPEEEDADIVRRRWYKLKADISGSYVLPPVSITFDLDGNEKTVSTSEIFIEIKAPHSSGKTGAQIADGEGESQRDGATSEAKDIRDIKAVVKTPMDLKLLVGLGLVGLLFVVGFGLWFYFRRHKQRVEAPKDPPHEVAIDELMKLKGGDLLDLGQVKEFHFSLSEIMRKYLEGQFGLPATDRTSEEIRREIHSLSSLNREHSQIFLVIMQDTDLVKFTDTDPGKEKSLAVLAESQRFVDMTRPAEEIQESVI